MTRRKRVTALLLAAVMILNPGVVKLGFDEVQAEETQTVEEQTEETQTEETQEEEAQEEKTQTEVVQTEETQTEKAQTETAQTKQAQTAEVQSEEAQTDYSAPYVDEVRVVTEPIGTYSEVEIEVDCTVGDAGINYIFLDFENEEGYYERFEAYLNHPEDKAGSYTYTIKSKDYRQLDATYQLSDIYIRSQLYGSREYSEEMAQTEGELGCVDGENYYSVKQTSYKVTEMVIPDVPTLQNISVEEGLTTEVQPGENFDLTLEVAAPEGVTLSEVTGMYQAEDGESVLHFQKSFSEEFCPGAEGSQITIPVTVKDYVEGGKYILTNLNLRGEKDVFEASTEYERSPYSGEQDFDITYFTDNTVIYADERQSYDGSADVMVAENDNADSTAPVIHNVGLMAGEASTNGTLEVVVEYTEGASGLKSIALDFQNEENTVQECFWLNEEEWEKEVGDHKTIVLRSTQSREIGDTYRLSAIRVSDQMDNYRSYSFDDWQDEYLTDKYSEVEPVKRVEYVVTRELVPEYLDVSINTYSVPFGKTLDNLSAGDQFSVRMTLYNDTDQEIDVTNCSIMYNRGIEYQPYEWTFVNGSIVVPAHGSREVEIPVQISPFTEKGKYKLTDIYIGTADSGEGYFERNADGGDWSGRWYTSTGDVIDREMLYGSTVDYTVTEADTPDSEAPYAKSIRVEKESVEAPGYLDAIIKADEGFAKLTGVEIRFTSMTDSQNQYAVYEELENGNLYYSPTKKAYVLEGKLDQKILSGDYYVNRLLLKDETGIMRIYSCSSSKELLTDWEGNTVNTVTFHIENTTGDDDVSGPVLESVAAVQPELALPGVAEYRIKANDEKGISEVKFSYNTPDGYRELNSQKVEKTGENEYLCTVNLDKYLASGTYTLHGIALTDDSNRENSSQYYVSEGELGGWEVNSVPYSGEADLTLTAEKEYQTFWYQDENLATKLGTVEVSGEVVIEYMESDENVKLSIDTIRVIKERKLQVTFINEDGRNIQVIVNGADITEDMIAAVGFAASGPTYEPGQTLDFGTFVDEKVYEIQRPSWGGNIPYTLKVNLGEDFYTQYKDTEIHYSEIRGIEEIWLKYEALQFDAEHWLEIPLQNDYGTSLKPYATGYISTETTKLANQALYVDIDPLSNSNVVQEGNSFEARIYIANFDENELKDVFIEVALYDRDGNEIPMEDGWFELESNSSDIELVKNEAGQYMIKSLKRNYDFTPSVNGTFTLKNIDPETVNMVAFAGSGNEGDRVFESFGMSEPYKVIVAKESTVLKGDMDQDGAVDMNDLLYMLSVVSKKIPESELTQDEINAGDVEVDESIDMNDLLKLLSFLSKKISSLE